MPESYFRARREELGLTQWDVATAVGTKASAPGQWERAESCPRLKLVPKIAAVLQTDEETIVREIVALDKVVTARKSLAAEKSAPAAP